MNTNELANIFSNLGDVLYGTADYLGFAQIFNAAPSPDRIKPFSFLISAICFALLVYLIMRIRRLNSKRGSIVKSLPFTPARSGVAARWEEIVRHINSVKEAEWKFAVIEADKLIDEILRAAGYRGETMGERLVNIDKVRLQSLDGLWEAHKLRNLIVHDTKYFARYAEAKRAINLYEDSLKELGIL